MLKCFIKEGRDREVLYDISSGSDPLLSPTMILPGEAYVYDDLGRGAFYDIAVGEWVEGNTLETEIRRAGREFGAPRFSELASIFDILAIEILSRDWAHGDLKPDNIVITSEGRAVLIDYDAMYVPGCIPNGETGTPGFQHPTRTQNDYGKYIDDYPIALISVSLHALSLEPGLYKKYHKGDGLILIPEEVCSGKSEAYRDIMRLFAFQGEYGLYALALKLRTPTANISDLDLHFARAANKIDESQNPQLFIEDGLCGYLTEKGQELTSAIFEEAFEFTEGLAVAKLCGKWHVIDNSGRKIFETEFETVKPFSHGLAAFRNEGKWGYLDAVGKVIIEPRFEKASSMHEGLAAVRLAGKYGFIDTSGQVVIPFVYDRARGFRDGQAIVESDGEIFNIDTCGNRI